MTTGADLYACASRFDGLPYRLGSERNNVPVDEIIRRRLSLDCSEMVERVCAWGNVRPTMVDGAANQYAFCRGRGTAIPVAKAIHVRGALGFIDSPRGPIHHVVMFAGDGATTMEAANRNAGCGHFKVTSHGQIRFTQAALIPGVVYPEMAPHLPPTNPAPNPLEELRRQIVHASATVVGFAPNEIQAGPEVVTLQLLLNGKFGATLSPPLTLSGVLDGRTQLVLIAFKRRWALSNQNVAQCGRDTWAVLAS
jgi:hypothetical protein